MPSVGVRQQNRIRQVLAQHVGISNRDHVAEDPVHNQAWLSDLADLREALPAELFPRAESGNLSHRNLRARNGLTILFTFGLQAGASSSRQRKARPRGRLNSWHVLPGCDFWPGITSGLPVIQEQSRFPPIIIVGFQLRVFLTLQEFLKIQDRRQS